MTVEYWLSVWNHVNSAPCCNERFKHERLFVVLLGLLTNPATCVAPLSVYTESTNPVNINLMFHNAVLCSSKSLFLIKGADGAWLSVLRQITSPDETAAGYNEGGELFSHSLFLLVSSENFEPTWWLELNNTLLYIHLYEQMFSILTYCL